MYIYAELCMQYIFLSIYIYLFSDETTKHYNQDEMFPFVYRLADNNKCKFKKRSYKHIYYLL